MIVNDPSRMYAALRNIEDELAKEKPNLAAIRAIVLEAGRELRPTRLAQDAARPRCKVCGTTDHHVDAVGNVVPNPPRL